MSTGDRQMLSECKGLDHAVMNNNNNFYIRPIPKCKSCYWNCTIPDRLFVFNRIQVKDIDAALLSVTNYQTWRECLLTPRVDEKYQFFVGDDVLFYIHCRRKICCLPCCPFDKDERAGYYTLRYQVAVKDAANHELCARISEEWNCCWPPSGCKCGPRKMQIELAGAEYELTLTQCCSDNCKITCSMCMAFWSEREVRVGEFMKGDQPVGELHLAKPSCGMWAPYVKHTTAVSPQTKAAFIAAGFVWIKHHPRKPFT